MVEAAALEQVVDIRHDTASFGLATPWPTQTGTILDLIGNTPLFPIQASAFGGRSRVRLWLKLERSNPGGSIKDRAAAMMIWHALQTGALQRGQTIIDSTSGNTGVALAMIGAALGYPVVLTIPSSVTVERRGILAAFGATVVLTDAKDGSDGAIHRAREIVASDPARYFMPDQYANPANPWAHYQTTGPEIWRATNGRVTHLCAPIGTGGTVTGTGRALRERNPAVRILAVEPDDAHHQLNGMRHIPSTMRPPIYDEAAFDRTERISTDRALDLVRTLAKLGLFVGCSSGAVLAAALNVAAELDDGEVVAIMPDGGGQYLSQNIFARVGG